MSSHTGARNGGSKLPRAVIHKKILDAAGSRPGASVEELANEVNGASIGLVERVLDEYGDPAAGTASGGGQAGPSDDAAADDTDTSDAETKEVVTDDAATGDAETGETPTTGEPTTRAEGDANETDADDDASEIDQTPSNSATNGSMSKTQSHDGHGVAPNAIELTRKQRAVLRAIRESPEATQSELADRFDVTQSTINNRLNSIEGFDWKRRHAFIEAMFEDDDTTADDDAPAADAVRSLSERLTDLSEQVETLERRLDDPARPRSAPFDDPDLACKVVRACINSEDVTVEEENRIMKAVISSGGGTDP